MPSALDAKPVSTAVILAGGKGTRLGQLTASTPKPILPVGGRPFIEYVIWNLRRQGVTDIVLSVGYLAQAIQALIGDGERLGVRIRYAVEAEPLGTGGGTRLAAQQVDGPFFVLNGDTLLDCSLRELAAAANQKGALAGLFLRHVDDAGRFGAVALEGGFVRRFGEKAHAGPGLINGGVYLLTPEAVAMLPEGFCSLEADLFPRLAQEGWLAGCVTEGFFLDMGLPETYACAQEMLPRWQARMSRPFVLLDRDGTIIVEKNYLHDPAEVELLPGAAEGLRALQQAGFGLAVVTNQAGIGRGYYQEADMHAVNARLADMLAGHGVRLDGVFFCPHAPGQECDCRKPGPGMARQAAARLGFDPAAAVVVGDKACDVDMGLGLGAAGVLVRTGYGVREEADVGSRAHIVVDDLSAAAQWIIQRQRKTQMADAQSIFHANIDAHRATLDQLAALAPQVDAASRLLIDALAGGGRIFFCGNGGSAADAQHLAAEFTGRYLFDRRPLDAQALHCNTSALTAVGNDYGFENVFSRQVIAHGRAGDVLVGISTSGSSTNVVLAMEACKAKGIKTIALTGQDGRAMGALADVLIPAPSSATPRIQEMHALIGHTLAEIVELALCAAEKPKA